MSGTLYIVATPIGNLEDLSPRALHLLQEVDFIIAEDTRRTWPLLTHFGIQKPLVSYFEHSHSGRIDHILNRLQGGENAALVTDAGTPGLSDPGMRVVDRAHQESVTVVPIPGPCAFITAVSASGLPTEPLHFWGFLSPSRGKRKKVYEKIQNLEGTHCFYESTHKIQKRLLEWKEFFPEYSFFVAKELTKKFETCWRGSLDEVIAHMEGADLRGEFTVVFSQERLK